MPKLSDNLRSAIPSPRKGPLWKGPEEDGITFSLLSRFLVCRERFRLLVVDGLRPTDAFNHRIEYGSMWHVCEEAHAKYPEQGGVATWGLALGNYTSFLCRKYPTAQQQVEHWEQVCRVQFPVYVDFWAKHPDVKDRTPLLQEQSFAVPYRLPSGRVVRLRGKWDSVDLIGKGSGAGIYLQENKTKGDIKESLIARQLTFDLQTMLYLVALESRRDTYPLWPIEGVDGRDVPIRGVRYNVVRRPLSGGRHSIVQYKSSKSRGAESDEAFYKRLGEEIRSDPAYFFMRWQVEITPQDILKFRRQCLDPILEQLCDWWEYIRANDAVIDPHSDVWSYNKHGVHYRRPFGVYNILDEGGASDLDEYLSTGSLVGLQQAPTLFPELE